MSELLPLKNTLRLMRLLFMKHPRLSIGTLRCLEGNPRVQNRPIRASVYSRHGKIGGKKLNDASVVVPSGTNNTLQDVASTFLSKLSQDTGDPEEPATMRQDSSRVPDDH